MSIVPIFIPIGRADPKSFAFAILTLGLMTSIYLTIMFYMSLTGDYSPNTTFENGVPMIKIYPLWQYGAILCENNPIYGIMGILGTIGIPPLIYKNLTVTEIPEKESE